MPFECPQNEAADPWDGKINGCVAVISICLSGISLGTSLIFLIRGSYTWWFSLEGSHYPYIGMILLSVFLLSLVAFSVWTNLSIHRRDNSKAIKVLLWLTFDFGRFATVLWTAALANHMGNLCQAVCLESFRYKSSFASDCKRILTVLLVLLVVEAIYLEVIEAYLATSDILPNLSDFPFAIMGGGILAWFSMVRLLTAAVLIAALRACRADTTNRHDHFLDRERRERERVAFLEAFHSTISASRAACAAGAPPVDECDGASAPPQEALTTEFT